MRKEDKLIQEYRMREVDFQLPLPEDGWDRLEAALSAAPQVRRFPYRWLAAAVSFMAVLGSALYFMGIDKEMEPALSEIVLPAEPVSSDVTAPVVPVEVIKPQPVAQQLPTVVKKKEPALPGLTETMSEVYMSISAYFHAEIGEENIAENNSNTRSVVEKNGQYAYVPEKSYEPMPEKRTSTGKGWTFGVCAGSLLNRHSSTSEGLQMLSSTANSLRDPDDHSLFEQIAASNSQKPTGTKVTHKFPLSAGLTVKKKVSDRFSIESGLIYTFLSSELSAGEVDFYSQEQRLHYLGIPLKVNYTLWKKDRLSVYATAGAMAELCVDGSLNTDYYLNNIRKKKSKTDLDVGKVQMSALASLGVQYDISKPVSIYAEPGIAYYFDDKSVVETIRKEQPLTASVQFGVRFAF